MSKAIPIAKQTILPIKARFGRLFEPDYEFASRSWETIEDQLKLPELWARQRGDRTMLPQGYTYLGQFLAHELAGRDGLVSRRGKLDLQSLYGHGAALDQFGFFAYFSGRGEWSKDLLRSKSTKKAIIADERNDEQLIIAQLHLLFQLVHNRALKAIWQSEFAASWSIEKKFQAARDYVIASIQRIYAEDFLPKMTLKKTREGLVGRKIFVIDDTPATLPAEISHATMRFGHSQVRDRYQLNDNVTPRPLMELFLMTGSHGGDKFEGVRKTHEIDWRFFFDFGDRSQGRIFGQAMRINPALASPMMSLLQTPSNIVWLNLRAGNKAKLPSGQAIARCLLQLAPWLEELGIVDEIQIEKPSEELVQAMQRMKIWDETPLWYFMLIEAEFHSDGARLGPLGTLFLCETLRNALNDFGGKEYSVVHTEMELNFGLEPIDKMERLITFSDPKKYKSPFPATAYYGLKRVVRSSIANLTK